MESKYNLELLTRFVLNEVSEEERKVIELNIKTDNELKKIIQEMQLITSIKQKKTPIVKDSNTKWLEIKKDLVGLPPQKQKIYSFRKYSKNITKKSLRKRTFQGWKYVAAIVLMVGISYYISTIFSTTTKKNKIVEYKTLNVNKGERKTIVLYDGTTINLDAGSELKYPKKFSEFSREVYLKGEGFFQVAKNPHKPFHIYVNNALIEVIGTKFNIRSWEEDKNEVTVTVTEGKVSLGLNDTSLHKKVYLTKNMQSSLSYLGEISKPIIVNPSDYTKWMNNEIYFQNANLRQIITQLERWYDLKFDVAEELLNKNNLTVHINNTNLNDVLELISVVTKTKIVRHGKYISFKRLK